jgi:hypothetical protein
LKPRPGVATTGQPLWKTRYSPVEKWLSAVEKIALCPGAKACSKKPLHYFTDSL